MADRKPAAERPIPIRGEEPFIRVRGLVAAYGDKIAVDRVSFDVDRGEQLSLLGPSGCGKSTTLRCLAGLETPCEGEIVIDSRTVFSSEKRINVPPEKRQLSMVFQSYAIWPHMTVFENVAYGLRVQRVDKAELKRRVTQVLTMVGMAEFVDRPATDLSGGQQQRVALARSYAARPKAVLLDEPLSNLDARLRARMREEMKELQREFDLSTVYVTHDQEEAMAISDRIIVMNGGRIEQAGRPLDIYDRPRTRFVADFIGAANIFSGRLDSSGHQGKLRVANAEILHAPSEREIRATPDGEFLIAVRTVYPEITGKADPTLPNQWPAIIRRRLLLGDIVTYSLSWPGGELRVQGFPGKLFDEGANVYVHIPPERAVLVDADQE